jgi:hypothetical protein
MRLIVPVILTCAALPFPARAAGLPDEIAAPDQALVATVHAVGAQIYECKTDKAGKLSWHFREPIASLFIDGKTVGRHYAGPNWEMADGSAVSAKVAARAAAASPADIPPLKLDVAPASSRASRPSCASIPAAAPPTGLARRTARS